MNELGYGENSTGLELDLVSNPTGEFLLPAQPQTEARFRKVLEQRRGTTATPVLRVLVSPEAVLSEPKVSFKFLNMLYEPLKTLEFQG